MSVQHYNTVVKQHQAQTAQTGPFHLELLAGGIANSMASFVLNPCDVVKVRLQVQSGPSPYYLSTVDAFKKIVRDEGVFVLRSNSGLWFPGIGASMVRELSYSSFRFALYGQIKSSLNAADDLGGKILAGGLAGAFGSFLAVPTDRLKIRLQREAGAVCPKTQLYTTGLFVGRPQTYPDGVFRSFYQMYKLEGGIKGMWVGWQPTMFRAAFLAAAQLSSYDHSKVVFKRAGIMEEGTALHVVASLISGVCTLVATQPFDVVKSRIMAADGDSGTKGGVGGGGKGYNGVGDCVVRTFREEGVRGFYRGSLTSYMRFGPHFIMAFPLWEAVRKALGLGYT